jgi:hypothetical protein
MEGALISLIRTSIVDEGEVELKYGQWCNDEKSNEKDESNDEEEDESKKALKKAVGGLSDAITGCSPLFSGSTLVDVILSASPKDKAGTLS